jgi:hypothetical protein
MCFAVADTSIEDFAHEFRAFRPTPNLHQSRRSCRDVRRQQGGDGAGFETMGDLVADLVLAAEMVPRDRRGARGRAAQARWPRRCATRDMRSRGLPSLG